jgi:hypothetical protein
MKQLRIHLLYTGILISLFGCGTVEYAPTKIEGTLLRNDSIGFHGFSIKLPDRYTQYKPLPKGTLSLSSAQWAWSMSTNYDKKAGYHALEHVAFEAGNLGIAMAIVRCSWTVPSRKDKNAYEEYIKDEVRLMRFEEGDVYLRDSFYKGQKYVGRACRKFERSGRTNMVYIVAVGPSTILVLNGVCFTTEKDDLMKDLDDTVAGLDVR